MTAEVWSIVSSIVSVILAVFAVALAIYFFVQTKNTEKEITSLLTKIETQAESLQKINAKWMDRLTRYVTEPRPNQSEESIPLLIQILAQLPQTITASFTQAPQKDTQEQLVNEIYSSYIALYFYIAQTNYWSQFYLPNAHDFDQENEFHTLVKRIVDMSNEDFSHIAKILSNCDQNKLKSNPLAHLLYETRDSWRLSVRSTSDCFVKREKEI
jgi:predicted PurR-regulated permease PerM